LFIKGKKVKQNNYIFESKPPLMEILER